MLVLANILLSLRLEKGAKERTTRKYTPVTKCADSPKGSHRAGILRLSVTGCKNGEENGFFHCFARSSQKQSRFLYEILFNAASQFLVIDLTKHTLISCHTDFLLRPLYFLSNCAFKYCLYIARKITLWETTQKN